MTYMAAFAAKKKLNDEFEYSTDDVDKQSDDMFTRRYVFWTFWHKYIITQGQWRSCGKNVILAEIGINEW